MLVLLIRTLLIYITIILALRFMGKRQLGELQPNELVVTIIISNIATLSLQDNDIPILGTFLPIFMLVSCEVLVSCLSLRSNTLRRMVSGNPVIVIRDGCIDQKKMRELRWTVDDLMAQLRSNDVFDIAEVNMAIVETSGSLSVYLATKSKPLTAGMMGIPAIQPSKESPPVLLISDGFILEQSLKYCGIDKNWLEKTLKKNGVARRDIFLMTCDRSLDYTIVRREKP